MTDRSRINRKFERTFPNAKQPHDYSKTASLPPMVDLTTILPVSQILGLNQPWPLVDVLKKLVEASEILLHKKSYDGHGYEEINQAVDRAKEIIALLNPDTPLTNEC
jgi:hypothetical protein